MGIEKVKELLVTPIVNKLNPDFIILYGSFAKGTQNEHSDLDIAYFSDEELSTYERFIFASKLSHIVKREVDLIDIKKANTVFTMEIFSEGEPIYIANENTFVRQRMRAYSMYVTLNEQRKPVIESIKESGRVFKHE
ncbi:MAG TPA: nucleotidyltransferase domain-containing protein [Bacillota bacterium]|nr:nucleotidyltransferase domain-containing protein [Bacillota bacterium]